MEYINVGKYVNTHGIKGEIRLLSDYRYKNQIFVPGFKIYMGSLKNMYEITSYRKHKSFDMLTLKGINDINQIERFKGSQVYINKEDLKLTHEEFLAVDLIGFNVIIDGKNVGMVTDVFDTVANEVLKLESGVLIPYVDAFILKIEKNKKEVYVKNVKGLLS